MPNFARTSTKVFTWRRADAPEIPLNHHEFTKEDVLDGRVFPFYNDMDPDENKCSVSLEAPKKRIGSIFVGDQPDVDHLRWYDMESLTRMLPRQKSDPDTLIPWGDFSRHQDSDMLQRIRGVLPVSFLNRWIANGNAREKLQIHVDGYKTMRDLSMQTNERDLFPRSRDDISLYESYPVSREFEQVIQQIINPNHDGVNNNARIVIEFLNEVVHFSLIDMIRIHKEWQRTHRNINTAIGWVNPMDLKNAMSVAVVAVQAFVRVLYPDAPLLEIVHSDANDGVMNRLIFLDAPLFNHETPFGDERPPFHCALYPSIPIGLGGQEVPMLPLDGSHPPRYIIYFYFINGPFEHGSFPPRI